MKNEKEIEADALEWSTDYKPWDEDLSYKEYAGYGYVQGYRAAIRDFRKAFAIKPPTGEKE